MKVFYDFIQWFAYITTGIVMIIAANFALFGDGYLPPHMLWQILLSAFFTAVATMAFTTNNAMKKSQVILLIILHYISLCMIMIVCGLWFHWIPLNLEGIGIMMISVAVVYGIVYFLGYVSDKKQVDAMNRVLSERNLSKSEAREEDANE